MKSKVALIPCDNYDEEKVYAAVKQGFDLLGGIEQFVKKEDRVLVKANLLCDAAPEKAATTHPAVFGAVLRCLNEAGCTDIKYGDSPGSPLAKIEETVKKCGLKNQADRYGAKLGKFSSSHVKKYPEGKAAKSFVLCDALDEADTVFEVCKMKTHALENITGAVKNQYGFIHGAHKTKGHAQYPNSKRFADMLADLNKCIGVSLHIMDGVVAMEGNGPASGTPVNMNVILMSKDPVALDSVFAKLVYLDPAYVPTCVSASKAGLGTMKYDEISIATPEGIINANDAAKKYGNYRFDVMRKNPSSWAIPGLSRLFAKKSNRPVVDPEKCIACGICREACPVDAVQSGNGLKAVYDYKKCIRCYCCQEMCPAKAITKK